MNKCYVCNKYVDNFMGKLNEGVIEYSHMYFCSEMCYKLWKTREGLK